MIPVPLIAFPSPQAVRIVKALETDAKKDATWVFPSTRTTGPHITHAQKAMERILERSGSVTS